MKRMIVGCWFLMGCFAVTATIYAADNSTYQTQAQLCLQTYNTQTPAKDFCCSTKFKNNAARCFQFPRVFSLTQSAEDNNRASDYADTVIDSPDLVIDSPDLAIDTVCQVGPHEYHQVIIPCDQIQKTPQQLTQTSIKKMSPPNPKAQQCLALFNTQSPARKACCSPSHDVFHDCGLYPVVIQTTKIEYPFYSTFNGSDVNEMLKPKGYKHSLWLQTLCQEVDTDTQKLNQMVARVKVLSCDDIIKDPQSEDFSIGDSDRDDDQ